MTEFPWHEAPLVSDRIVGPGEFGQRMSILEARTTRSANPHERQGAADLAPLRILALNWRCFLHEQAGGAERNLQEQARRWAAAGHDVTLFTADPGRAVAPRKNETIDGVTIRRMGGRFTVYLYAAIYLMLRGRRFDRVLDIANGIPFFTPLFTRTPRVLFVHHVHEHQWASEFSAPAAKLGWFLESKIVPRLYRDCPVVAVSPTTRDALVKIGFSPQRINVVYNGVDARHEDAAVERVPRTIAYIGRLKKYKRLDRLVQVVADLRATYPDIRLDIAGDGDARPALETQIKALGLDRHVTLHGFVDETTKDAILRRAVVFATPSMNEGWGLSVIEANAFGCPAVAYDVPGLSAAIQHGETGLLAHDDASFRGAISLMLKDEALQNKLSVGALAWSKHFDWDSCASSTLQILHGGADASTILTEKTASIFHSVA